MIQRLRQREVKALRRNVLGSILPQRARFRLICDAEGGAKNRSSTASVTSSRLIGRELPRPGADRSSEVVGQLLGGGLPGSGPAAGGAAGQILVCRPFSAIHQARTRLVCRSG